MADNVSVDEGADKAIATDEVAGVHYQKIKLDLGGDGIASPLVRGQQTKADSIPVALASDSDTLPVSAASLPLPTGAATAANQQTDALTDAELRATAVDVDTGLTQPTTPADTQPVSAASLPLPTGAASSAKQDTAQTSLSAIAAPQPASLGQKAMAASYPVVLASDQDVTVAGDVNISGLSGLVDTGNSYSTVVADGVTESGSYTDVTDYGTTTVLVRSDSADVRQEITVRWSTDGITGHVGQVLAFAGASQGVVISVPTQGQFVRVDYFNNTGSSRTITLETIHSPSKLLPTTYGVTWLTDTLETPVTVTSLPTLPVGDNNIGNVDVVTLPELPAGTNAIGKLAANSGVDIGDVDVTSLPALPAGTNTIGNVGTKQVVGTVKDDSGDEVTVKVAKLEATAATTRYTVVPAVANKKIRVIGGWLSQAGTGNNSGHFESGTTDITAPFYLLARAFHSLSAPPGAFLFETTAGAALSWFQDSADDTSIHVIYIEAD